MKVLPPVSEYLSTLRERLKDNLLLFSDFKSLTASSSFFFIFFILFNNNPIGKEGRSIISDRPRNNCFC